MCSKDTSLFLYHNGCKIISCILTFSRLPHVRNPQHWYNETCSTYPMGIILHDSSGCAAKSPGDSRNIIVCSCVILISLICGNIDNNIRHIYLIDLSSYTIGYHAAKQHPENAATYDVPASHSVPSCAATSSSE